MRYENNCEDSCCRIGIYGEIVITQTNEAIVAGRAMDPIVKGMTGQVEPVTKTVGLF